MADIKKIAFQGTLGAYSHMACQAVVPEAEVLPCASFSDMLNAATTGSVDAAMVPVENSTAGRVADIHHLLPGTGLHIIGEHFQPVSHCLLGLPGTTLDQITEVHSHEQGLAQCRIRLESLGIKPVIHSDTAGAAKDIAAQGAPHMGSISSRLASEIYGLDILLEGAEDLDANTTRFLLMAPAAETPTLTTPSITTIIFTVRSVPAVLYKALGGFATNGINLTKIESYMRGGQMGAAQFYIDCEGHIEDEAMQQALEELRFYCVEDGVRIMGCYPASPDHRG